MKSFKQHLDDMKEQEANPTSTSNVVGTGSDVADWKYDKRKRKPLTRHFIEIDGKRKKLVK